MFRDILHKLKIFFCDDDVEKIYVRDSTVIRNNEIHRMYNEILDELGNIAPSSSHILTLQVSISSSNDSTSL